MNEGIKLLLKRMESNPEEFFYDWSEETYSQQERKWSSVISQIGERVRHMDAEAAGEVRSIHSHKPLSFLSDEEVRLVYDRWAELQQDAFTHSVMRVIMEDPKKDDNTASQLQYAPFTTRRRKGC